MPKASMSASTLRLQAQCAHRKDHGRERDPRQHGQFFGAKLAGLREDLAELHAWAKESDARHRREMVAKVIRDAAAAAEHKAPRLGHAGDVADLKAGNKVHAISAIAQRLAST